MENVESKIPDRGVDRIHELYSWIAYTWRDHFVSKVIDVDSGVATHRAVWAAAPTKLLGPQAPMTNHMWGPSSFLPQGPLRPSYATDCGFPVFDFVYLCSTL
jgi:hypothetical protein